MLERDLIQEPSPAVVVLFEDFLSSQERQIPSPVDPPVAARKDGDWGKSVLEALMSVSLVDMINQFQEREQDLLIYGSHFRDQNGNRVDPAEVIIREDQPVSRVQQPAPFFMGTRHIYHIE